MAARATRYVSQWATPASGAEFSRQAFLNMLEGKVPFLRKPGFVSRQVAQRVENVMVPQLAPYLHKTGPALRKVGVAQFEFQAQSEADLANRRDDAKEQYFEEVRKHQNLHVELAEQVGQNLWQSIVTLLQSELPEWDVGVASEGKSQNYFSGIFRCINESTPIHCDWSPYDSRTEDWMVKHITRQGVFNLYLAPFHGGRTEIYDTQWTEEALQFRDPDSYGYWPELVKGRQKAVIRPEVGDLYFFNTRNMHQVFPVEPTPGAPTDDGSGGRRQRLTLSSFYGLIPGHGQQRPKLILWS